MFGDRCLARGQFRVVIPSKSFRSAIGDEATFIDPNQAITASLEREEELGKGLYGSVHLFEDGEGKQYAVKEFFQAKPAAMSEFVVGLKLRHVVHIKQLIDQIREVIPTTKIATPFPL